MFNYYNYSIFSGSIRLIQLQTEYVPRQISGTNLLCSLNKRFNQIETNKLYSTILSSNWKSSENFKNKNTSITTNVL